jgi:hypothetical protein
MLPPASLPESSGDIRNSKDGDIRSSRSSIDDSRQEQRLAREPRERERDVVIPALVAVSLLGYALVALLAFLESLQ